MDNNVSTGDFVKLVNNPPWVWFEVVEVVVEPEPNLTGLVWLTVETPDKVRRLCVQSDVVKEKWRGT